ncbi:MAG: porin family protein [Ferruginibacter sp.]
MKVKSLLLATLLVLIVTSSFAQKKQKFYLGIKAGADMNKIDGQSFNDQFSFGYQAGAFVTIPLGNKFGIQPEVIFSQVNIDTSSNFSDVYQFNQLSKVKLQYLKIPLLLNFSPNPFVSFQLGPQFGILIDQNINLLNNGSNALSKGDFSMVGGLQLNIFKLRIYGRYGVGLNNLNDIDKKEKWRNQNFQFGVGFAL